MADGSKQSFLNALFQWTVKNSSTDGSSDAAAETNESASSMKEEDKKWLTSALDNITVNPVERLKICIKQIKENSNDSAKSQSFLDELCHWTEELDIAKDFFAVGGLEILVLLLDHHDDEIRMKTCSLMATLVQNNDHCQRIIVQSGLQEKLLKILEQSKNNELQTSALTAISALIRGYTLGQLQLQKYQGPKILLRSLSLPNPRLQVKLCFLVNTICSSSAHMKKIFFENGALDEFIRLFNNESCPDTQHVLETIVTLSSIKENSLNERDPTLLKEFQEMLNKRLTMLTDQEHHQDEISIINQLQSTLKFNPS